MIELIGLSKIYNEGSSSETKALDDISIHISKKDYIAIMGRSGSGKSTLLNILGCIENISKGQYLFDNEDIMKSTDKRKAKFRCSQCGIVMQDFALVPEYTVYDNVEIPLYFSGVSSRERKAKIKRALEYVGISDLKKKYVHQLSGGQKQRVAISRAIVNEPDIILADEPTGALDEVTSSEIMALFKKINDNGTTIIMATHERNIANCAKSIIIISDGKIIDIKQNVD